MCNGGLHMMDISVPSAPVFLGCWDIGYIHDTECINYESPMPDTRYYGREICFISYSDYPVLKNYTGLVIVDVTNKSQPVELGRVTWPFAVFAHQGALTQNARYFLMGDEIDEGRYDMATRSFLIDLKSLTQPKMVHIVDGLGATGHNMYNHGSFIYQSNYKDGLRILKYNDSVNPPSFEEIGYFDVFPLGDMSGYEGSWSNYLFPCSRVIAVSSIEYGLFFLKPKKELLPPQNCLPIPSSSTTSSISSSSITSSIPISQAVTLLPNPLIALFLPILHYFSPMLALI
eukprot:TRINITY_DN281_c0_g1_i1.p1 TRINITY_DN281_c0_g1~~TRINITY_DN281_c0_g1_i1.p1  ORF type:complete len:315 (-),score=26.32 TRINITY_DN281_c0_g1_i1:209-1069(-)